MSLRTYSLSLSLSLKSVYLFTVRVNLVYVKLCSLATKILIKNLMIQPGIHFVISSVTLPVQLVN